MVWKALIVLFLFFGGVYSLQLCFNPGYDIHGEMIQKMKWQHH